MRPQKLDRLLGRAIYFWMRGDSAPMYKLLPELKRIYPRYAKQCGGDWRGGEETYGYGDREKTEDTLNYISDRWRCAFRIRWIIDGLEKRAI